MTTYRTSPPAKLNLFLEILGRRDDGFHELDTVMVAIDWSDELAIRRVEQPGIRLHVRWLPDPTTISRLLGVSPSDPIMDVPTDHRNLVHQALTMIGEWVGLKEDDGGWEVDLGKRIPSGAGMGGASSDAAAALRLAARSLIDRDPNFAQWLGHDQLLALAARLGSDVPFFLNQSASFARATGRGEKLEYFLLNRVHQFFVVYPAVSLSTAKVYGECRVPGSNRTPDPVIRALSDPPTIPVAKILYNALREPACGLVAHVGETLGRLPDTLSLQSSMTGSGSACFVWASDPIIHWEDMIDEDALSSMPIGLMTRVANTCAPAPEIYIA